MSIIMIIIETKENSIHTKPRTLSIFPHYIRNLGNLHTSKFWFFEPQQQFLVQIQDAYNHKK